MCTCSLCIIDILTTDGRRSRVHELIGPLDVLTNVTFTNLVRFLPKFGPFLAQIWSVPCQNLVRFLPKFGPFLAKICTHVFTTKRNNWREFENWPHLQKLH